MQNGFLWNSNTFSHDLPFLWEMNGKILVELPRHPFGDGRLYGHHDNGNPFDTLAVWKAFFDELHEDRRGTRFMSRSSSTLIFRGGRAGRGRCGRSSGT